MDSHPYAEGRIMQAKEHLAALLEVLRSGDMETFVRITENEALSLHGLMLSSDPSFLLMEPATIGMIRKIRSLRETTHIPLCFTLDAGPNVHLLYREIDKVPVEEFIREELLPHCEGGRWISDKIGNGPVKTR